MKTSTIKQEVTFKALPHEVYEALMDSAKHSQFTGAKAQISREVGGKFSVYDGWIEGENLELVQDKKIVQTWHGGSPDKEWPKGHNSKVTFELEAVPAGTKLTLTHEDIPEGWEKDLDNGWQQYYWKPMKEMLEK